MNACLSTIGLALAVAAVACESSAPPVAPPNEGFGFSGDPTFAHSSHPRDADLNKQLAELRRTTAPFHRLEVAMAAGWNIQLTGCLDNPPLGAQGFHYANGLLIDGTVNLTEPELLTYEPGDDGFRLVGVEYIVPFAAVPATDPAPSLLGQAFHANMDAGIWALHVWVWRHNPSGMFADWNPKVSC